MNGKPIYRKVILLEQEASEDDIEIVHNLNIDECIKCDLTCSKPSASPLLINYNDIIMTDNYMNDRNGILIQGATLNGLYTYHLIFEYTKL